MYFFSKEYAIAEYYSSEVKQKAGFGKDGEKGFEGTITDLQMQMYLCVRDFRQRKNKKGEEYGWAIAVYSTLEHVFGYEYVTSAYREDPVESGKRIVNRIMELYPSVPADKLSKLLGRKS